MKRCLLFLILFGLVEASTASRAAAECRLDAPNTVDTPRLMALGETCSLHLEAEEVAYFMLSAPVQDLKITLDAERPRVRPPTNLQTKVELLNADGSGMRADPLFMNTVDVHSRSSVSFVLPKPKQIGFKITNIIYGVNLRLTIQRKADVTFLPLFGRVEPGELQLDTDWTSVVNPFDDVYFRINLARGAYKALIDVSTADGTNTNLQMNVKLLPGDGSGDSNLLTVNEIATSFRQSASFSTKSQTPWIVRVYSTNNEHAYRVRLRLAKDDQ